MKDLGEYLKNTREQNGVGLEEASVDLEMPEYELESIEEGNIRAFKDTLVLKEKIKKYAKYLGLDPQKIADEFNDFMFEHTSKISLEDIKAALQKQNKEEEKKVYSPYTKIQPPKKDFKPLITVAIVIVIIMLILLGIMELIKPKRPVINQELISKEGSVLYEFTK